MAASSCLCKPNCSQGGPCGLDKWKNTSALRLSRLLLLHRVQDNLDFSSLGRSWFGEYVIFAGQGSPCAGLPSPDTSIYHPSRVLTVVPSCLGAEPEFQRLAGPPYTQHCASLRHVSILWDTVTLKAGRFSSGCAQITQQHSLLVTWGTFTKEEQFFSSALKTQLLI